MSEERLLEGLLTLDKQGLGFRHLCHGPRGPQAPGLHTEKLGEGPGGTDAQPHPHSHSQLSGKQAVGEQLSQGFPRTPLVKSRYSRHLGVLGSKITHREPAPGRLARPH